MNHNITTKTDKPANQMWGSEEKFTLRNEAQKALDKYKENIKETKIIKVYFNPNTWIEIPKNTSKKDIKRKINRIVEHIEKKY